MCVCIKLANVLCGHITFALASHRTSPVSWVTDQWMRAQHTADSYPPDALSGACPAHVVLTTSGLSDFIPCVLAGGSDTVADESIQVIVCTLPKETEEEYVERH